MKIQTIQDYNNLMNLLRSKSDGADYINFQKKIINTQKEIIGVRSPVLREISKSIDKNSFALLTFGDNKIYEEVLVKGFFIAKQSDFVLATSMLDDLLPQFDTWAETDAICCNLNFVKKNKQLSYNYFANLTKSNLEFVCRFGIVCLMKYFITDDFYPLITLLNDIKCDKYYVNMAISWLLCEILVKNPQNTVSIMKTIINNYNFSDFVINKAIQKATESFRLDTISKTELRKLKK